MSAPDDESIASRTDREATEWLARLRGSGALDQQAFEDWYSADPAHADGWGDMLLHAVGEGHDELAAQGLARAARSTWEAAAAATLEAYLRASPSIAGA